jgi:histidinol-phosphate aminotransferase
MPSKVKVSRRAFARGVGLALAAAPVWPAVKDEPRSERSTAKPIRLHFNENPYGPSPLARRALLNISDVAWQYPGAAREELLADLASLHGVPSDHILLGNGSAEILHAAALAFLTPSRPLVVADPTYEALEQYARGIGAKTVKIPLGSSWAHDLAAMLEAGAAAGILYICNPNNPTAGITPRAKVKEAVGRTSTDRVVLVDEAYAHYVVSSDYESVIPLVRSQPNLIVLRTFSKIYGLAGLRIGYCVASPPLVERLRARQSRNSLNAAALLAARASLADAEWVATSRSRNQNVRDAVIAEVNKLGFNHLPTEANFFMVDLETDVSPVIAKMHEMGVHVGRPFPPLRNHLRVTVGTEKQMARFVEAFRAAMT